MLIEVKRYSSGKNDTLGKLYIDGVFMCYTLEDEFRKVKVKGDTRIAAGTYVLSKRWSPKFSPKYGHEMLWVLDVNGFEFILIHPGNTEDDTDGCLLVGLGTGVINKKRAVTQSRKAYDKVYPIISGALDKGEKVLITYID